MIRPPRRRTIAAAVVAITGARARRRSVGRAEELVFRTINSEPDSIHRPVWLIMQSGSLGAAFGIGAVLRAAHRPRRAVVAVAAGSAIWGGVKLIKPCVGRGRPAAHLDGVRVRGAPQTGLGYPSGHAAVATTLALVSAPAGHRCALAGLLTTAGLTGVARVYVGAHLPLDVIGGHALGALAGAGARTIATRLENR